MSNINQTNNKCAVVTGASSGIGYEISKLLINNGYKVFGIGRDFNLSKDLINNPLFNAVVLDLTDTKKLERTISKLRKTNSFSLLVNNAGVGFFGPHECLNASAIHEMVCVNLEVPMLLTNLLLRDIKENMGTIVNISSVTAKKINTHGCTYGATKAGLTSFAQSLFDEVRKHNIKVITIHPDMTSSKFYRNADFMEDIDKEYSLMASEIAETVIYAINQRKGMVINDITIKPQKHKIIRKNKQPH